MTFTLPRSSPVSSNLAEAYSTTLFLYFGGVVLELPNLTRGGLS